MWASNDSVTWTLSLPWIDAEFIKHFCNRVGISTRLNATPRRNCFTSSFCCKPQLRRCTQNRVLIHNQTLSEHNGPRVMENNGFILIGLSSQPPDTSKYLPVLGAPSLRLFRYFSYSFLYNRVFTYNQVLSEDNRLLLFELSSKAYRSV